MRRDDPNDYEGTEDEYVDLQEDIVNQIEEEIEFERSFYRAVCDTDNFEVVLIPDEKGYVVSKEEKYLIELTAAKQKIKILYRVSHGKFATVFDPQTGKLGIMPETNTRGFAC